MRFISYAQNYEDVMLWRALGHVENGFYVDVGAADPDVESVTRAFYERGWSGINIEPVGAYAERLEQARPRDTNLRVALGTESGEATFFEIADTGLSTMDEAIAHRHEKEHGYHAEAVRVPVNTLATVLEEAGAEEIHFLKVDVEGAEEAVLRGMDFARFRPWVVVVEATRPNTTTTEHQRWEPIVLEANYRYVYFDGLNRFYVAREHEGLEEAFHAPPNIFDDFVRASEHEAATEAQQLDVGYRSALQRLEEFDKALERTHSALKEARTSLARTQQEREWLLDEADRALARLREWESWAESYQARMESEAARLRRERLEMINSRSWQLTKPLREFNKLIARMRGGESLGGDGHEQAAQDANSGPRLTGQSTELSPRAREIHRRLLEAIRRHQRTPR